MKIWKFEDIRDMEFRHIVDKLNQLELDRDKAIILVRQAIESGFDPKSFVDENLPGSGLVESRQAHAVKRLSCNEGSIPSSPNQRQSASNAEQSGEPLDNGSFLAQ